ncbi:MarR family winged helix-turn-helix transcriptional regulator [Phyllobacterium leguminum]|uniref:DNA-binding MarR family transcriptional regulator n=1 Tax=Phyllobacterium leguminum TaxID=314237 RepID=A0A318T3Y1_9HYPH|nr:MarR family transcriptional regulator [Phyllobacterium leguminum]PYE88811.1 DNA-binding MarR family transcriptional regulator [Phyllobacterium leguminum]
MTKERKQVILYRLQSAARLGRTSLATRLLEHGLYAGQDAIMLQLAAEDGQSPGVLAQRLGVRPPTVTKTISRLQSQGFVTKQASERDQRQAHVFLTDNGRDVIRTIEKSIRKTEKDALRGLDKKERKTLLKLLNRLEFNLSAREPLDEAEGIQETAEDSYVE